MNLLDFFRLRGKNSANAAKERLQIVVSHQKAQSGNPDYIPKLRQELLDVIAKYIQVDKDQIQVQLQQDKGCSILELNVTLPI